MIMMTVPIKQWRCTSEWQLRCVLCGRPPLLLRRASQPPSVASAQDNGHVSDAAVAYVALAVSLAVAGWQVLQYVLEGGRVRVRMQPGLLTDYILYTSSTWRDVHDKSKGEGGWPVEVAVINIENLGRTPVTISQVSLDLGRPRRWKRARHTISPRPIKGPQATLKGTARLEPFDSQTFIFDIWGCLTPSRGLDKKKTPKFPLRVRAACHVAGKRRMRRSPWRTGWPVQPGQRVFVPELVEIGLMTYRALWRHTHDDMMARVACIPTAIDVREHFPADGPPPDKDALKTIMDSHTFTDGAKINHMSTFYAAQELVPYFAEQPPAEPDRTAADAATT